MPEDHPAFQLNPYCARQERVGFEFASGVRVNYFHAICERLNCCIANAAIGELAESRAAVADGDGQAIRQAELRFQAGAGDCIRHYLGNMRTDFALDALHLVRQEVVLPDKCEQGIERPVRPPATRIGLDADLPGDKVPRTAEGPGDLVLVVLARCRKESQHPEFPSETVECAGQAELRQGGREDAIRGRNPGVEGLGHRAKVLADAARFRGSNAERHLRLPRVELEELRSRGSGPESAEHGIRMPAMRGMLFCDAALELRLHLEARNVGFEHFAPGRAFGLAEREQDRQQRQGRVEVQRVADRAVRARSRGGRSPEVPADHAGGGCTALGACPARQDPGSFGLRAGD